MTETHVDLPDSHRPPRTGARKMRRKPDPKDQVDLTVTLRGPALPAPDKMPAKALTLQQFARKYGAKLPDIRKAEAVLKSFGLKMISVSHDRRALRMTGSVAAVEAAFKPGLTLYHQATGGKFRGRETTLQVPKNLEGVVTGVFGLDQRPVARRRVRAPKSAKTSSTPKGLGPTELEARYRFPSGGAPGQTIAIAEFGGAPIGYGMVPPAWLPGDLIRYSRAHKRQRPVVTPVPVNLKPLTRGQYLGLASKQQKLARVLTWEVMLDVELAAGLAPAARIDVYFATYDQKGWIDLLDQVTSGERPCPVSLAISWGHPEDSHDWSAAGRAEINLRLQKAALLGITICAAAGDDGSGDAVEDNHAHVGFPASSPFVLAVGGTMSTTEEVAWREGTGERTLAGGGSTGGGVSTVFAKPRWQKANISHVTRRGVTGRIVPDVAALAGPPGYDAVIGGQHIGVTGTSAAAPLWAALIARLNALLPKAKQQRFMVPSLYRTGPRDPGRPHPAIRDIVSGDNISRPHPGNGYRAGPGFDAVTGWGVPDGEALLAALSRHGRA